MERLIATIIVVTICGFCAAPADGETIIWTGNGDTNNNGSWADPNNWDLARVPGEGDMVILPSVTGNGNSGDNIRTITIPAGGGVVVAELRMFQDSPSSYNVLELLSDLEVATVTNEGQNWRGGNRINLNSHDLTVKGESTPSMPVISGTGEVLKEGSASLWWGVDCPSFAGAILVNGGSMFLVTGEFGLGVTITIAQGAEVSVGAVQLHDDLTVRSLGGRILFPAPYGQPTLNQAHFCRIVLDADTELAVRAGICSLLSGEISGQGGVTKTDGGVLILSGNNTYAGETVVSEGVLQITGFVSGDVTVLNGATLRAGPDQIGGSVTVETGGTWQSTALWSGAGSAPASSNNDGPWSDPENWTAGMAPGVGDYVVLQSVTGAGNSGDNDRTVTLDQETQISELRMMQESEEHNNVLRLDANLTVPQLAAVGNRSNTIVDLNGWSLIVEEGRGPTFCGTGQIIKNGSGWFDFYEDSSSFEGTVTLNAGEQG